MLMKNYVLANLSEDYANVLYNQDYVLCIIYYYNYKNYYFRRNESYKTPCLVENDIMKILC